MYRKKASFLNYALSYSFYVITLGGALIGFVVATKLSWDAGLLNSSVLGFILEFITFILPTTAFGFMLGVFPTWAILGRLVMNIQGDPFEIGDTVTILRGTHKGKMTRVYEVWYGQGRVRVELGEEEKTSLKDI